MATGAPGTNGVWQYGEDDSEATFSALLNKAASTTDTQLGLDRARLTTLEARKLSGLVPIVPTSVAKPSGTASYDSVTGLVTFSGVPSISLNGVFTSTYMNYRILLNINSTTGTGGSVGIRLRNAGADRSTSSYGTSGIQMTTAGANSAYNATTTFFDSGYLYIGTQAWTASTLEVKSPQDATVRTKLQNIANGVTSAGVVASWVTNCLYDVSDSNDGITILPTGSATITGTMKVYGYN